MDYTALVAVLSFFAAFQLVTRVNAGPLACTLVAVALPYAITVVTKWVYTAGYGLPVFGNVFTWENTFTVTTQFIVALIIFKKLRDDDSLAATIGWAAGGFAIIILLIPFVARKIFIGV